MASIHLLTSTLRPGDHIYLSRKRAGVFATRTRTVVVATHPAQRVEGSESLFFDAIECKPEGGVRITVCAAPDGSFERVEAPLPTTTNHN